MKTKEEKWEIASAGQGEVKAVASGIRSVFKNLTEEVDRPSARNAVWTGGLEGKEGMAYWQLAIEEGNQSFVEIGLTDRKKFETMKVWNCFALVYTMGRLREGTSGNSGHFRK